MKSQRGEVKTIANAVAKIISNLPPKTLLEEDEKIQLQKMSTEKVYTEDGIPTQIGDMQGRVIRSYGPGFILLGYYNSDNRWAYAPDESGHGLGVKGESLKNGGKSWTQDHTPERSTGLLESIDLCGRKYLLISANRGYVPTRTDGDPHLAGWTDLDSKIRVVFDNNYVPHPACEHIDYEQHGFTHHLSDRVWWPRGLGAYQADLARGALSKAGKKLQVLAPTALKAMSTDVVCINPEELKLSSNIYFLINLLIQIDLKMEDPRSSLKDDVEAKIYRKITRVVLELYKEYDSIAIEKKLQYLHALNGEALANLLNQTAEVKAYLDHDQTIDFLDATAALEQFFVMNFKIMTKNGTETRAFIERPYSFWIDTLNDIADDRQRVQSAETRSLADPLLRDLTKTFTTLDQHNREHSERNFSIGVTAGGYSTMTVGGGIGAFFGPIGFGVGLLIGGITTFAITTVLLITEGQRRKESSRRQPISITTNRKDK